MSENNEDLTQDTEGDSDLVKHLRSELRATAGLKKTASEAIERAAALEKQATFKELGIDPNEGVGKLFFDSYKGDADAAAIKAEAEKYSIPLGSEGEAETPSTNTPSLAEQAAHAAINRAAAGAGTPDVSVDPNKAGWEAHAQTLQATGNPDAAMAAHFGAKLHAAVQQKKGA